MSKPRQENLNSSVDLSKRKTLRWLRNGAIVLGVAGLQRIGLPLAEELVTWKMVDRDTDSFIELYRNKLSRMHLGANITPDYELLPANAAPDLTIKLLKDYFGCSHIRLGTWWRTYAQRGLDPYYGFIESALKNDIKTTISYGIKSPYFPETKFPWEIDKNLWNLGVSPGGTVTADSELAKLYFQYSDTFLNDLDREFGLESFAGFNPQNEYKEHFGEYKLAVGSDIVHADCKNIHNRYDNATILLNTSCVAPFGKPAPLVEVAHDAIILKHNFPTLNLRVGTDIYEETDVGRLGPNSYIDTFAGSKMLYGSELIPSIQYSLAKSGIVVEVTEGGQLGDWVDEPRVNQPGSRIHTQYMIARIANNLVDEQLYTPDDPLLIRLWEMEPILLQLLANEQHFFSSDTYTLLHKINRLT